MSNSPFGFHADDENAQSPDAVPPFSQVPSEQPSSSATPPSSDPLADDEAESAPGGVGFSIGMPGMPFSFSGGASGVPTDAAGMPDLGAMFTQLGKLFSWSGGPVNWDIASELARQATPVMSVPMPSGREEYDSSEALKLAELWLDPVTSFPAGATKYHAWNRAQWVEASLPSWKPFVEPIATRVVAALGDMLTQQAPEEMAPMVGSLESLMRTVGSAMFGSQVGQAFAALAEEVFGTTDIGLPLGPEREAALIPANVEAFAKDINVPVDQVRLYVALREAAVHRLFAHAGWLAGRLTTDITQYATDITIDTSRLEQAAASMDPNAFTDPDMLGDAPFADAIVEDLFSPAHTPAQEQVLLRLEGMLALIEGWVDTVVSAAAEQHLPAAAALQESVRRRRAVGGPAELTFANLVGLELRPRKLREAAALWRSVEAHRGVTGRDAVWDHPDYVPSAEDLDDPEGFATRQQTVLDLTELNLTPPPAETTQRDDQGDADQK